MFPPHPTLPGIAALACLATLMACSGGTEPSRPVAIIVAPSLSIVLDDSVPLDPPVEDSRGHYIPDPGISWQSLDPSIVTVDQRGMLRGLRLGATTVRATIGSISADIAVTVAPYFTQLAVGEFHVCAIAGDGRTFCWGDNIRGQLGRASGGCIDYEGPCRALPHSIASGERFVEIAAGGEHTCALKSDGTAWCWGSNASGELGAPTGERWSPVQVAVSGPVRFRTLALGRRHSCGISLAGDAWCWGEDIQSQLGLGATAPDVCTNVHQQTGPCSVTPRQVVGGHTFAKLAPTERGTCGLTTEGRLYCWGLTLGTHGASCGEADCARVPVLASTETFVEVTVGYNFICGLLADGSLRCWGYNHSGQFGNGTTAHSDSPTPAASGLVLSDAAAGSYHACGLTTDQRVYCWGSDLGGEVGASTFGGEWHLPAPIAFNGRFTSIATSAASHTTCGLTVEGRAYCWGTGGYGTRGDGSFVAHVAGPQQVGVPRWNY